MAWITPFLDGKLHLKVNREKSKVALVQDCKFLGYRIFWDGRLALAPRSLARVKERIREITRRNRGVSLPAVIQELNSFLTGA